MATNDQVIVIKKKSVFGKIKDWWKSLDTDTRDWLKITAIWTVDGALIGGGIVAGIVGKKTEEAVKTAAVAGYLEGKMDAYREMIRENPYIQMDIGMKKLDRQGKVTHF